MKHIVSVIFFAVFAAGSLNVFAEPAQLGGYQETSGAITNGYAGDTVDPYFATKAMLILLDMDPKAYGQAVKWAGWAIHMQQPDGLFERYRRDVKGIWRPYAHADADDAALALWLELLYRLAPSKGMQESWGNSADLAENQLATLYDPEQGIYHISADIPVGLLMDNVEIYSAFMRIAQEQRRLGEDEEAIAYEEKAALLAQNILEIFRPEGSREYRISTQRGKENLFYPDRVAQLYPLLYGLPDNDDSASVYSKWMSTNGHEWLSQKMTDYPWGLVAITALKMDDNYSASCWQNRAEPMRYSIHWNVLEEATLQYVKWCLASRHYDSHIACVGGNLS